MELESRFFNHDAQAGGFYPKSHTGISIKDFISAQNVLVEGIRGTGKTHVLKMVEKYCIDEYRQIKVLPVFVSLAQISEHARKEANEFRLHLNAHIVQRCIETLETHKDSLQHDLTLIQKAIRTIKNLFGIKSKNDSMNDIICILKEISEDLLFKLQYDLTSEQLLNKSASRESNGGRTSAKLRAKGPGMSGSISAENFAENSAEDVSEETIMYVGRRLVHQDASSFIIEFLKQIQILLDLNYVLLLLDECSEASFASQVEVFRLFKAIRGARSGIASREHLAFFLGGVYPHGETYYPSRAKDGFSFEPGQDCAVEFIQWDEIDIDTYISFYKEMTLLRARDFLNFNGSFEALQQIMFDEENTFYLAAYCSNGIPRRYWQLLKQAYDSSSKRIIFSGVDAAIQEIANNQILLLGKINECDLKLSDELIDILSNKNIDIRRRNEKMKDKRNRIPQNIYFSVYRQYKLYLSRLVLKGAIHDKSRMRTLRRRSMQPMYSIDMAVAYAFRVIPPKSFTRVIHKDIPRCPNNNFDQAPEIRPRILRVIYDEASSIPPDETLNVDQVNVEGFVISYERDKFGYIDVGDGGQNAFFWSNHVDPGSRSEIKIGDKVTFSLKRSIQGRQAIGVKILEAAPSLTTDDQVLNGRVVYYKVGKFGFINLFDGKPNVYFTPHDLEEKTRKQLEKGDFVDCKVREGEGKRLAYDITIISKS